MTKYIFFFFTFLCFSINIYSQSVGITDFMRLNPYSTQNNPAYFLPYNGYVGIPAIANANFNCYNSSFIFRKLVKTDRVGNPTKITLNRFVKSLAKNNWLNMGFDTELLGFGFRVDNLFFSVGYRLKMEEYCSYSKDLFVFLLKGNLAQDKNKNYLYTKSSPAILRIEPNINMYQELSLSVQTQITKRLYIGARPKLLFGLLNLKTNSCKAKLYTDPADYTTYGNYEVSVNMASVIPFYTKKNNGDIDVDVASLLDFKIHNIGACFSKNLGFAIDLGAVYRVDQQIRVSASITDIGFIKWRGTPLNLSVKSLEEGNNFEFAGFTEEQITNFFQNEINKNLDSIVHNIVHDNVIWSEIAPYKSMLTAKVMADCYFDLTPSNRFILQCKGFIIGKSLLPQLTLAYNGTFFNLIDVVCSYSIMKKSYTNLGLGLGLRLGPVHLYMGADNILTAINVLNSSKFIHDDSIKIWKLAAANVSNSSKINVTLGLLVDLPISNKVKEAELKYLFKKTSKKGTTD